MQHRGVRGADAESDEVSRRRLQGFTVGGRGLGGIRHVFPESPPLPARTTVGVSSLPGGGTAEVSMVIKVDCEAAPARSQVQTTSFITARGLASLR